MHIMHLRDSNFVGGPERQILEHVRRAENGSLHLSLCCFRGSGPPSELEESARSLGLDCTNIMTRRPLDLPAVAELSRRLRDRRVDLLVTHGYKPNLLGRLASWTVGIPTVAVSRGWTYESRRVRCYEFLDRIFLRLADRVVAVSEAQRRKVLKCGVRPDKIRVIHNAIDLDSFPGPAEHGIRAELGISRAAVLVATAGRLSPEKNHVGLVSAAKQVLTGNPDIRFVVFGEGCLRPELEQAVADAGIASRFFLPGFRGEVRSLLHEADIFVLPSHTEGLPNVVLEAFACRAPVVATRAGGTPEVVKDGENGVLVAAGDMTRMAEAILALAGDTALRRRMGQSGFRFVESEFGFERQTRLYRDLYKDMNIR